jgi:hypothetical protein
MELSLSVEPNGFILLFHGKIHDSKVYVGFFPTLIWCKVSPVCQYKKYLQVSFLQFYYFSPQSWQTEKINFEFSDCKDSVKGLVWIGIVKGEMLVWDVLVVGQSMSEDVREVGRGVGNLSY